jgi:hypothetical protein
MKYSKDDCRFNDVKNFKGSSETKWIVENEDKPNRKLRRANKWRGEISIRLNRVNNKPGKVLVTS